MYRKHTVKGYLIYGLFSLVWAAVGYFLHNLFTAAVFLITAVMGFAFAAVKYRKNRKS